MGAYTITSVGRVYRFRGRHTLPAEYGEPWCYPHDHDYTVEVAAVGDTPTDDLDHAWNLHPLAQGGLIDVDAWHAPSTVEQIATDLLEHFGHASSGQVETHHILRVTVREDDARWGTAERAHA